MAGEEWGFPEREGESNGMQGESSNKKRVDFGQGFLAHQFSSLFRVILPPWDLRTSSLLFGIGLFI